MRDEAGDDEVRQLKSRIETKAARKQISRDPADMAVTSVVL